MKSLIIGLHGCYCHPFKSWSECDTFHSQKMNVGQPVKNRCNEKNGVVESVNKEAKGFVTVKYGSRVCDLHLEHVANLIKLNQ